MRYNYVNKFREFLVIIMLNVERFTYDYQPLKLVGVRNTEIKREREKQGERKRDGNGETDFSSSKHAENVNRKYPKGKIKI